MVMSIRQVVIVIFFLCSVHNVHSMYIFVNIGQRIANLLWKSSVQRPVQPQFFDQKLPNDAKIDEYTTRYYTHIAQISVPESPEPIDTRSKRQKFFSILCLPGTYFKQAFLFVYCAIYKRFVYDKNVKPGIVNHESNATTVITENPTTDAMVDNIVCPEDITLKAIRAVIDEGIQISSDVFTKIANFCTDTPTKWYKMNAITYDYELLLYPETMRKIEPVKQSCIGRDQPADLANPACGTVILPDVQLWVSDNQLRLDKDTLHTNTEYAFDKKTRRSKNHFFDGITNKGRALYGCSAADGWSIYVLTDYAMPNGAYKVDKNLTSFYSSTGALNSLTLQDSGTFMCMGENKKIENQESSFFITRGIIPKIDRDKDEHVPIESWSIKEYFKKIIPISPHIYIGLMDGRLASIRYIPQNEKNHYPSIDVSVKKVIYGPNKQEDLFDDIAVDVNYKTAKGTYPRIALLNKHGDIFATDLQYTKGILLLPVGNVADAEKTTFDNKNSKPQIDISSASAINKRVTKLFYDKDRIGIYKSGNESKPDVGKFIVWPINLEYKLLMHAYKNRSRDT